MCESKVFYPFYRIRRTLLFLRWILGFPLQAKDDAYSEFRFITWLECVRFLIMVVCLQFCILGIVIFLTLFYDTNLEDMQKFLKENMDQFSTNSLDNYLAYLWPIIVQVSWLTHLMEFKFNVESINEFCSNVGTTKSKMNAMMVKNNEKRNKHSCIKVERAEKMLIYGIILSISAAIMMGAWLGIHYNTFIKKLLQTQSSVIIIVLSCLFAVQSLFLLYGPISMSAELVICQYINSLTDLFETWKQIIESDSTLPTIHTNNTEMIHEIKSEKYECRNLDR